MKNSKAVFGCVAAAIALGLASGNVQAQEKPLQGSYKTFALKSVTNQDGGRDIQTDLRNMIPEAKVYYLPSQQLISVRGSEADLQMAEKILADIDKETPAYRLTYTITEIENGKRGADPRSYSFVVVGGRSNFRQGTRVPIVTGTSGENGQTNNQVQYVDVGIMIEATLSGNSNGLHLRSKIEESKLSEDKSLINVQDPVIKQRVLETETTLTAGKALVVGSLDVPGTERREEIAVTAEALR